MCEILCLVTAVWRRIFVARRRCLINCHSHVCVPGSRHCSCVCKCLCWWVVVIIIIIIRVESRQTTTTVTTKKQRWFTFREKKNTIFFHHMLSTRDEWKSTTGTQHCDLKWGAILLSASAHQHIGATLCVCIRYLFSYYSFSHSSRN